MFLPYIDGVKVDGENMSYFNLIDFGDFSLDKITAENWQTAMSSWKVNVNVFAYFLKRSQILSTYQ
jgi:hypothetical protein